MNQLFEVRVGVAALPGLVYPLFTRIRIVYHPLLNLIGRCGLIRAYDDRTNAYSVTLLFQFPKGAIEGETIEISAHHITPLPPPNNDWQQVKEKLNPLAQLRAKAKQELEVKN